MKRYRRLWRRLLSQRRIIPASIRPRLIQPPVPTFGLDVEALRKDLSGISIGGSSSGEFARYVQQDMERFLRTVDLVPADAQHGLEIGSVPYFTTLLLRWVRPLLNMKLTNFFNEYTDRIDMHHVSVQGPSGVEEHDFHYHMLNVENTRFPFENAQFDLVMFCEVLEHMTNDPLASLREMHRVISPGGYLILTTPNAARLENAARLLGGLNMYDQYSGQGAYGRHNREYTADEIRALLVHSGFVEECLYTADVYDNHAALHVKNPKILAKICAPRRDLLGQYIFSRWRRIEGEPKSGRPAWLYRGYSDDELSSEVPLEEPAGSRW